MLEVGKVYEENPDRITDPRVFVVLGLVDERFSILILAGYGEGEVVHCWRTSWIDTHSTELA